MTSIVPSEYQEDIPMCLMSEFLDTVWVLSCTLCLTPRNCEDTQCPVFQLLDMLACYQAASVLGCGYYESVLT